MNSKMTTNSELSKTEPKKKKHKQNQTRSKQTTRGGTCPQKWRSHGGLSVGRKKGETGGKVQGLRSIIGRY